MKATEKLHNAGQSLWLDNITRSLLDDGTIQKYIDSYSVTGLTSNPSIFDKAIGSGDYDDAIRSRAGARLSPEDLFFELAIEDLRRAADLFLPIHERTDGVDGWVSLEVSPLLAYDTAQTVEAAKSLCERAGRSNLFIKIPGTPEGLPAITEAIAAGVPVNVTLLFSADQYRAAADAYLKGVERRIAGGLNPAVGSVASVFMSRWDTAVAKEVPIRVLARIMGLPEADLDLFIDLGDRLIANTDPDITDVVWGRDDTDAYRRFPFRSPYGKQLWDLGRQVVKGRLRDLEGRDPGDDLLSRVLRAEVDGERLRAIRPS